MLTAVAFTWKILRVSAGTSLKAGAFFSLISSLRKLTFKLLWILTVKRLWVIVKDPTVEREDAARHHRHSQIAGLSPSHCVVLIFAASELITTTENLILQCWPP
jgi:hypothetical protein